MGRLSSCFILLLAALVTALTLLCGTANIKILVLSNELDSLPYDLKLEYSTKLWGTLIFTTLVYFGTMLFIHISWICLFFAETSNTCVENALVICIPWDCVCLYCTLLSWLFFDKPHPKNFATQYDWNIYSLDTLFGLTTFFGFINIVCTCAVLYELYAMENKNKKLKIAGLSEGLLTSMSSKQENKF